MSEWEVALMLKRFWEALPLWMHGYLTVIAIVMPIFLVFWWTRRRA